MAIDKVEKGWEYIPYLMDKVLNLPRDLKER